jgi:PAS domain S-box-containing protein
MTPLSIAYVATAAICVVVALQHLLLAFRVPDRRIHLLFVLATLAVAGDAMNSLRFYWADRPEQVVDALAWSGLFLCSAVVFLAWFVDFRTGVARRWLVVAETLAGVLAVVFGFTVGITYTEVTEMRSVLLSWGETVTIGVGPTSSWHWLGDAVNIGFFVILIDTTMRLARRGEHRQARVLGGALVLFSLALLLIIPTDLGLITLPGPHTFAFLLIVAAMSWDLTDELIRASRLSREVLANERRWRQLLDDVRLLAARVDTDGRIVELNPHFDRVLGYGIDDARGREFWSFLAPDRQEERRSAFHRAMAGNPTTQVEVGAMARDGAVKHIVWRNVLLRDRDGEIEGMLSIGADVTDQRDAESERDRVLTELEATVCELEVVRSKLEEENIYLKEEIGSRAVHGEIIGQSDPLLYVLHKIEQVAATDATVLIQGETGVGKELVASTIHQESDRSAGPFLAVNCAALPASLVESELFGHEKGAFTDADRRRKGRFELADGGTLFLDEVGELPLDIQPKLLRVLQDGLVDRVGGSASVKVDVRLIAATNRDLRGEVEAGKFREDLFYRLDVYPITVPPLRDRCEDIDLLVGHFARRLAARHKVSIREVPQEVMRQLEAYDWPGNVRELQNVIERAVLTSSGGVLKLVGPLEARSVDPRPSSVRENGRLRTLEDVERSHIEEILRVCGGQIAGSGGAAEILGLHANTLRSRLKKLGIKISK